jgi:hypothetical protein
MATIVYRNCYFWVNGVDYSADTADCTLNYKAEMLDETAMGDDTRIKKGGLKVWDVSAKFHQDYTSGHVGQAVTGLWSLVGTTTCIELRPQNACSTLINPQFFGVAILESFPPMAGGVGSLLDISAAFQSAGTLSKAGVSSS